MNPQYSSSAILDIILLVGECKAKYLAAARPYTKRYPKKNCEFFPIVIEILKVNKYVWDEVKLEIPVPGKINTLNEFY